MRRQPKTNKHLVAVGVAILVAIYGVAFGIGQHREKNMALYAIENNCEWHYTYIDQDPICK